MDYDRNGEAIIIDGLARLHWNGRANVNRWEQGQLVRILAKAIKRYRVQWEYEGDGEGEERDIIRLVYPDQLIMED